MRVLVLLALSACCGAREVTRPCPESPRPPPEIVVLPPPTCALPAWPDAPDLGATPHPDGGVIVTRAGLANLGAYAAGVVAWADAAMSCLARPEAP